MPSVISTGYPGVYYRKGEGRKRIQADGSHEKCYCIRYLHEGKLCFQTVGWESEGVTLEQAVVLREKLNKHPLPAQKKERKSGSAHAMKRLHAGHAGVYYRYSKDRRCLDGKPDKCYDILYYINGKLAYEKVGWISEGYTLEDAIKLRGHRVKALRHPELCPEESLRITGKTLNEIWDLYQLRWLPNLRAQANMRGIYEQHLAPAFGKRVVGSITRDEIEAFKHHLLAHISPRTGERLSPSTVKIILSSLRRIINKGITWGLVTANPVDNFHVADSDQRRERFFTVSEIQKLFEGLTLISCQLYFIAKVSLYTGMRLGEVLNLKKQDIDHVSCSIAIVNGKTGRRTAFFPPDLLPDMSRLLPPKPSDFLFANPQGEKFRTANISAQFSEIINAMRFNDGVTDATQKVVFHTLRHTFCSWLAMKGVPLYTIGQLAGHASVDMTQRYAKLSPDSKREALKYIGTMLAAPS